MKMILGVVLVASIGLRAESSDCFLLMWYSRAIKLIGRVTATSFVSRAQASMSTEKPNHAAGPPELDRQRR